MKRFAAAVSTVLFATGHALAADVPVTACGQQVPASMRGVLMQDLACASGPGIVLAAGSSLDLNGFSIVGSTSAVPASGLECSGGCRVDGPGTVRDFSAAGIHAAGQLQVVGVSVLDNVLLGLSASVVSASDSLVSGNQYGVSAANTASLTNVDVLANLNTGIIANKVALEDCDVSDNGSNGVLATGGANTSVLVRNSTIQRNGRAGISNTYWWRVGNSVDKVRGRTRISDSQVTDNAEEGVLAVVVNAENSTFDRNHQGINASRAKVVSSSLSDNNERGLSISQMASSATGCKVEDSVVSGNGLHGIYAGRNAKISTSQVENNGVADCSEYLPGYCADVFSHALPKLKETTCGRSSGANLPGVGFGDWDVCSLD